MKEKLPIIARYLLGIIFFGAGLMGLLQPGAPPPDFPEKGLAFFNGMAATGYFIPFLKITETTCGLLLLINRAPALALIILAPITIQIFLFHLFCTPGIQFLILPIFMILLHSTAARKYWQVYKPLFGKGILCLFILFSANRAHAATSPIAISLVPPVQFPASDSNVTGLRMSLLMGHHRSMYGIDLGVLGNATDVDFAGIALSGIYNVTYGQTSVVLLQAAAVTNINVQKTSVTGLQLALVNSNAADSRIYGFAVAPIANLGDHTKVYGFEVGIYNKADEIYGFQIGVVNIANNVHGLQIGLINFHHKGLFAVCPILNFGW